MLNRERIRRVPVPINRFSELSVKIHRVLFALFLVQFLLVWVRLWLPLPWLGTGRWPDGLLLVLAAATTVASLARQLPGGNVMLASIIIAVIGAGVETLGARTSIPFGPFVYTDNMGQQLFYP